LSAKVSEIEANNPGLQEEEEERERQNVTFV
jgi:hypothetical protein